MLVHRYLAVLILAAAAAGAAGAQTPAPDATPAAQCVKPDSHPGRLASDNRKRSWTKEANAWQECEKKRIAEIQAKADQAVKVANAAIAESNAAVAAFNAAVKDLQAQAEAAQ